MKRAASLCLLTVLIAGAVLAGGGSAAADPGWGAAVSLESNNLDAVFPQVAVDPRGNAIAVWRQFDGNIDNLTANRYVAGLGWTGEVLIEAGGGGGAPGLRGNGRRGDRRVPAGRGRRGGERGRRVAPIRRHADEHLGEPVRGGRGLGDGGAHRDRQRGERFRPAGRGRRDRKSTRLNSSHSPNP